MKGKCRVPSAIKYAEIDDNTLAAIRMSKGRDNGNLVINKKVFGNIDESMINKYLKSNDKISPSLYDTMSRFKGLFPEGYFDDLEKKILSFRQNPEAIAFEDKVKLYNELSTTYSFVSRLKNDDGGTLWSVLNSLKENSNIVSKFYKDNDGRVVCKLFESDSSLKLDFDDVFCDVEISFPEHYSHYFIETRGFV